MRIARPPTGFEIREKPAVADLIAAETGKWPRLPEFWRGIKQRLAMTGHREGVPVRGKPGWQLFVAEGEVDGGLPRVKVVYLALGDTLTIYMVMVGPAS